MKETFYFGANFLLFYFADHNVEFPFLETLFRGTFLIPLGYAVYSKLPLMLYPPNNQIKMSTPVKNAAQQK